MKKRSEFMKDKVATPAEGTASTPASTTTPAISADKIVPKVTTPATPPKTGRIEAVTPPIEVIIPPKEGDAKVVPATPPAEGAKKADPKKPAEKKDPKKKPK